jgi:homoserine kinase
LNDLPLIARTLEDHVAEPKRASLVPGFHEVKQAAGRAGALGCSLSGSGPSIFALCASVDRAALVGEEMRTAFARVNDVGADLWISPVGTRGARIVAS